MKLAGAVLPTGSRPRLRSAVLLPDEGPRAGLGHVGRCLALAQALQHRGWDARLVLRDVMARRLARSAGIRTAASSTSRWDLVVVDSYLRPRTLLRDNRARADLLAAIDDRHVLRPMEADFILRPSIGERSGTNVAGGSSYVLLRREHWRPRLTHHSPTVRRVLVTLGGYPDPVALARVVSAVLGAIPGVRVDVILGTRSDVSSLRLGRAAHVVQGPIPLRPLLMRADLVVTAGGQTLYEVLATGRPAVVLLAADNQVRQVRAAARAGAVRLGPWLQDPRLQTKISRSVRELASDPPRRHRLARTGRGLVDGRGALRAAAWLTRPR